jgi:hypothetical protein
MYGQHPSESVLDPDKYGSETTWSCIDKHFGYYFISYSIPIPIEKSIENAFLSHSFNVGYTYRYKIAKSFDIGTELSYVNRTSSIVSDSIPVFDPGTFYNNVKTYQNALGISVYLRIDLGKADYRNLGWFIDLGGYYNYNIWYGIEYLLKSDNVYQKARFKQSEFLNKSAYGGFFRLSKSNIAFIFSYSMSDWINGFSNEDLSFQRTPFMAGFQFNLYAK